MPPKIFIASDHAGFETKSEILKRFKSLPLEDLGPHNSSSTDYPDWADLVALEVSEKKAFGILVCGSGIGMCIRANRYPGVRAALAWDPISARLSREHNDANILCLGSRLLPLGLLFEIIETFFATPFAGGRHQGRVDKLDRPLIKRGNS
jgi:ribose 5-phosphate isomerase B